MADDPDRDILPVKDDSCYGSVRCSSEIGYLQYDYVIQLLINCNTVTHTWKYVIISCLNCRLYTEAAKFSSFQFQVKSVN